MNSKKPNIVWILLDHYAYKQYKDVPGAKPHTPTLDRISNEGISFNHAYTVCPLCGPVRATMLTGQYPHNHGIIQNDGNCGAPIDFDPDIKLFNHYLQKEGYKCGYFGKWHSGHERIAKDYGFEGWSLPDYGFPYNTDIYEQYLKENNLPEPIVELEWGYNKNRTLGTINLREVPHAYAYMETSGVLKSPLETHEAHFVTHLANKWLEVQAQGEEPIFLRVDVWGPHQPYYVAEPFKDTIDPAQISEYPSFNRTMEDRPRHHKVYYENSMIQRSITTWSEWQPIMARCYEHVSLVDSAVGKILDTLDRCGLADNTLVVYTTDHGDILGTNRGLFDKSAMMVEETMQIPMAIRWPGKIRPGLKSDALVTNMDVVATVLQAAGAEIPDDMDSESMVRLFDDPNARWREDLMCEHHGHGMEAFQRMLRWKNYKYVAHYMDIDELYDLEKDPFELNNLANNPGYEGIKKEMQQRLSIQMKRSNDRSSKANDIIKGFGL